MADDEPTVLKPRKSFDPGPKVWYREKLIGIHADFVALDREDSDLKSAQDAGPPEQLRVPGSEEPGPTLKPGNKDEVLRVRPKSLWADTLSAYHRRRVAEVQAEAAESDLKGPAVQGAKNWKPLGPTVMLKGQARGQPPMGGRVAGLVVAPGGRRLYAATANGGVFRSDDAGMNWQSMMDGFDLNPQKYASTSLCCGAIGLDPRNPNRVYVGTGEGAVAASLSMVEGRRSANATAYRGVGPIRSADDGSFNWIQEDTDPPEALLGEAFFQIAVDPRNGDRVFGATTNGLYERVLEANQQPVWIRRHEGELTGIFTSVVAVVDGPNTIFYAAEWGRGVYKLEPGKDWQLTLIATVFEADIEAGLEAGLPTPDADDGPDKSDEIDYSSDVARISLAVSPANPTRVYAMLSDDSGVLYGLYAYRAAEAGKPNVKAGWRLIVGHPCGRQLTNRQGNYDLAIAVDPNDASYVYVGGAGDSQGAYIWSCKITDSPRGGFTSFNTPIGGHAHADVHVLTFTPGNSNELWAGTDGGVFVNLKPNEAGLFQARNDGLASLCITYFDQHPTNRNIMIAGLQDNGTAYTNGNPKWTCVGLGDGGYCLFNWANPNEVVRFQNGGIMRSENGGATLEGFPNKPSVQIGWEAQGNIWVPPIVGTPYNPSAPQDAQMLAAPTFQRWQVPVAGGKKEVRNLPTILISRDFGRSWFTVPDPQKPNQKAWKEAIAIHSARPIFAMAFASANRLFAATGFDRNDQESPAIFRLDYDPAQQGWTRTLINIDDKGEFLLPVRGLISDIGIDWADPQRNSIYITLAGTGIDDNRHVWHYDGTRWQARSGPGDKEDPDSLLDVEHTSIVVDPVAPNNVYAGADIGVWHSANRGQTWKSLPNGLPDAAVYELRIHPTQRLLRAALHGRGLYEWELGGVPIA